MMKGKLAAAACVFTLIIAGVMLAGGLACGERPPTAPPAPGAAPAGAPMRYRGLAIQVQSGWKPVERFVPLLREVAGLGANTVLLITAGFMENAESQMITIEARKTPAPDEFKTIIREARQLDLQVILMPIVLLSKPRGSEWRGVINPPDWDDWWRQYREFISYFCDIAREGGATGLMVGSELVSTEKNTAEWLKVIELARQQFYGGDLGYSANWDHYRPIKFWDKLDLVGMTSYYTLADHKDPTVDEIVARWQPICDEVSQWQREIGKPLLFTEVGWCSQEGAAMAPWNYYNFQVATPGGQEEQRRLYEAFLRVWDGSPSVAGVIWWEWSHAPGGPDDYGYTPRGKPAERVLREWFAKYHATTAPSNGAATKDAGAAGALGEGARSRPSEPRPLASHFP